MLDIKEITGVIPKQNRKKILLLADDFRMPSGIGTMSKQIILHTCHYFNWVQIGAAIQHPDKGKIFDMSDDISKQTGVDASVKLYPFDSYGNPDLLRALINTEKPDAILHFTDPRQWIWLYNMSHEIRQQIPIIYYNIWDCPPAPMYNRDYYRSCDLIMNISRQTDALVHTVLGKDTFYAIDNDLPFEWNTNKVATAYVPHGANDKSYFPVSQTDKDTFKKINNIDADFILFWNNRNIRRKMPADLIMAFKRFVNKYAKKSDKCMLIMHTANADENGTDLDAVIRDLANDINVRIINKVLSDEEMNLYYNIADATINIASNEGFGLSGMESLSAGTMIINNVTGGLQDQCRFETKTGKWIEFNDEFPSNHIGKYKKCANWAIPIFPASLSLQGSIPTPYIYDDRCNIDDIAEAIKTLYELPLEERNKRGLEGYNWVKGTESMMSATQMGNNMIKYISALLNNWKPIPNFKVINATTYKPYKPQVTC